MYLNETAYLVWQLCRDGFSEEEIVRLLVEKYPQQRTTIGDDVRDTLASLVQSGAILPLNE